MNSPFKLMFKVALWTTLLVLFMSTGTFAQELDNKRLTRDIEIAQNILSKLFGVEPENSFYYNFPRNTNKVVIASPREAGKGYYVSGQGVVLQINYTPKSEWSLSTTNTGQASTIKPSTKNTIEKEQIIDLMKEFYLKYADLIGQLKPEDKIVIVYEENHSSNRTHYVGVNQGKTYIYRNDNDADKRIRITSEIDRESIAALKAGQMSEENFLNKIVFHESSDDVKKSFDFDVLSGILETLFRDGNSEHVNIDDGVEFNYIDGFGVNYYLSLHTVHNSRFHNALGDKYDFFLQGRTYRIIRDAEDGQSTASISPKKKKEYEDLKNQMDSLKKADEEKIQLAIKEIEPKLKEYIIEYGRTLKSLQPDEVLVINVRVNRWAHPFEDDEDDEKNLMRLTVKQSVLTAYDNRELSLQSAMEKVEVTK